MVNKSSILSKALIIGVFIILLSVSILPSTAFVLIENIDSDQTKLNIECKFENQPFEKIIQEKKHGTEQDFRGDGWILYPTDDTFIEKIFPDDNYGSLNSIKVGRNGNGYYEEDALIKFDVSSIPSGINVFAKLFLYYYDYEEEPNDRDYNIYRVTSEWDEDNITWNSQPSYEFIPTDIMVVPDIPGVWLEFDVTEDIRNFIEGNFTNHGWIISDDDDYYPEGQREANIYSKENGDFIPYLLIKAPSIIYVDDDNVDGPWDGTIEYPFKNIQDGIDISFSGDTIYVYSGTYNESVVLHEEHINLIGESKTDTIIFNKEKQYGVLIRNRYYGITINGFTVQTDSNNDEGYAGIALDIYSKNSNISDNILLNNKAGIVIWGSDYNLVFNNEISDYVGICLKGGNDHNIISNNEINDVVSGISLEDNSSYNNLEFNNILNAEIGIDLKGNSKYNTINNNFVSNSGNGIYIDDHLHNNISNNLLDNNNNGINAHKSNGNISIIGNTITQNKNGIYIDANVYGNISGNIIDNNICGIYCCGGGNNNLLFFYNNNIANNKNSGGIFINHAMNCKIFNNNFINNEPNARFVTYFNQAFGDSKTSWYNNYWDNLKGSSYKIFGRTGFIFCLLPWIQFDQNPATDPYDIEI